MKLFVCIAFLSIGLFSNSVCSQNKNALDFFSIIKKEAKFQDYYIGFNYYTLKNNINNTSSSVYISDSPTLNEIQEAATKLPSDFFTIKQKQTILNMIILINSPIREFLVVNSETGNQERYECKLFGDITENRAKEIVQEKFDPKARIVENILFFNNSRLTIISNHDLEQAVYQLIHDKKLKQNNLSHVQVLSRKEIKEYILKESKNGGKLDFFTAIKGHEDDILETSKGIFTTKIGQALFEWGKSIFELGTPSEKEAIAYWTTIKGNKPTKREIDYLIKGLESSIEN